MGAAGFGGGQPRERYTRPLTAEAGELVAAQLLVPWSWPIGEGTLRPGLRDSSARPLAAAAGEGASAKLGEQGPRPPGAAAGGGKGGRSHGVIPCSRCRSALTSSPAACTFPGPSRRLSMCLLQISTNSGFLLKLCTAIMTKGFQDAMVAGSHRTQPSRMKWYTVASTSSPGNSRSAASNRFSKAHKPPRMAAAPPLLFERMPNKSAASAPSSSHRWRAASEGTGTPSGTQPSPACRQHKGDPTAEGACELMAAVEGACELEAAVEGAAGAEVVCFGVWPSARAGEGAIEPEAGGEGVREGDGAGEGASELEGAHEGAGEAGAIVEGAGEPKPAGDATGAATEGAR